MIGPGQLNTKQEFVCSQYNPIFFLKYLFHERICSICSLFRTKHSLNKHHKHCVVELYNSSLTDDNVQTFLFRLKCGKIQLLLCLSTSLKKKCYEAP